jgi:hypothetical protein
VERIISTLTSLYNHSVFSRHFAMIPAEDGHVCLVDCFRCVRFRFVSQVNHYLLHVGQTKYRQYNHEQRFECSQVTQYQPTGRKPEEATAFIKQHHDDVQLKMWREKGVTSVNLQL